MTRHTYRFAFSSHITVDEETLKRALIGMGIRQFPGDPVVTEDDQFNAKFQMSQEVDARPPRQLLRSYRPRGHAERRREVQRHRRRGGLERWLT